MTTPRQREEVPNIALCNILRGMMLGCEILPESTRTLIGHLGKHPDMLITARGRSPMVVEAEYQPAPEAEKDARERLGLEVTGDSRTIEAAIALRYPESVKQAYNKEQAIAEATLSYCVFSVGERRPTPDQEIQRVDRFPESGWLVGSVADLADLIRLVSVPQLAVETAANALQEGIRRSSDALEEMESTRPYINAEIANRLGMENVPQTRRMAGAIIANAMIFQERIAGIHQGIKSLSQVCGPGVNNPKAETLAAWTAILGINYWPIFDIARQILNVLPSNEADTILRNLEYTAGEVGATGVDNSHDLTGRVFQRLIADRKYLATFYTLPASAALLARLAVAKLEGVDWANVEALGKLRIGDFACGTGALLSAVYEQIAARHEQTGGDLEKLHPVMMEEVLYGCDVLPSAVHITSATLSGAQPTIGFSKSRLYTMRYGRLSDGTVATGSLEFLAGNAQLTWSNFSDPALRTAGSGDERAVQAIAEIPDEGFDLVIMNPPFTRAGSDWEGSEREADSIKQFRGLSTDLATQKEMSKREKEVSKDTCAHGYAGIASTFAALANRKLKPGGVLALVLPLSAAAGISWQMFRQMLAMEYSDLTVLSNVANGKNMSFSSDTGMGECLVIARKLKGGEQSAGRVTFVSLASRPQGFAHAAEIARSILQAGSTWQLEDGPYDGEPLQVGSELVGKTLTAPCSPEGDMWSGTRISDYSLAQTAHALTESRLWLPGVASAIELRTAPLTLVGQRGLYDMNIAGKSSSAPFDKVEPSATATYPALWNHYAKKETKMVCVPDIALQVKPGQQTKAAEVWATASRGHINRDFSFNSQPLAAAFTEWESIGGRAWPNVQFNDSRNSITPFVAWCNSTLGMLSLLVAFQPATRWTRGGPPSVQ